MALNIEIFLISSHFNHCETPVSSKTLQDKDICDYRYRQFALRSSYVIIYKTFFFASLHYILPLAIMIYSSVRIIRTLRSCPSFVICSEVSASQFIILILSPLVLFISRTTQLLFEMWKTIKEKHTTVKPNKRNLYSNQTNIDHNTKL